MSTYNAIKQFWTSYAYLIERLMEDTSISSAKSLTYWQNQLFSRAITYALPISVIILIPCVILELKAGNQYIAIADICMVTLTMLIALNQKLTLDSRKVLVVFTVTILSVVMIVWMGSVIMGFMYLFALIIFIALQFSDKLAYGAVGANLTICTVISLVMMFQPDMLTTLQRHVNLNRWLVYSTNFIFLNLIIVGLIRQLLNGLGETMLKVVFLYQELHKEVAEKNHKDEELRESEIQHTKAIKVRNEQLKEIAYLQSHTVRRPLANIKGILVLLTDKNNLESEQELLQHLDKSVRELDVVINDIVRRSNGE